MLISFAFSMSRLRGWVGGSGGGSVGRDGGGGESNSPDGVKIGGGRQRVFYCSFSEQGQDKVRWSLFQE